MKKYEILSNLPIYIHNSPKFCSKMHTCAHAFSDSHFMKTLPSVTRVRFCPAPRAPPHRHPATPLSDSHFMKTLPSVTRVRFRPPPPSPPPPPPTPPPPPPEAESKGDSTCFIADLAFSDRFAFLQSACKLQL